MPWIPLFSIVQIIYLFVHYTFIYFNFVFIIFGRCIYSFLYLFNDLFIHLFICLFVYYLFYLFTYLFIHFIYLFIYLFIYFRSSLIKLLSTSQSHHASVSQRTREPAGSPVWVFGTEEAR